MMKLSSGPVLVFVKLLATIFIAEAAVMFILPVILPRGVDQGAEAFVDSCLLTLFAAPLVWWVIIGPLRATAEADKYAALAQVATGLAHELRNPLTAVKMLVQSQREAAATGELLSQDLRIIEEELRRMERSIQTFLDYARPRAPEPRPLDPADLILRTFALTEPRARKQHVEQRFVAPETATRIEADPDLLQQVLLNFCVNALDAMPRGGLLTVGVARRDQSFQLYVQDSGPGIDANVLPRLFEPFVTSKEAGVGLGLVVCRQIAESHGGRLRGENLTGGARFTLELPQSRIVISTDDL